MNEIDIGKPDSAKSPQGDRPQGYEYPPTREERLKHQEALRQKTSGTTPQALIISPSEEDSSTNS